MQNPLALRAALLLLALTSPLWAQAPSVPQRGELDVKMQVALSKKPYGVCDGLLLVSNRSKRALTLELPAGMPMENGIAATVIVADDVSLTVAPGKTGKIAVPLVAIWLVGHSELPQGLYQPSASQTYQFYSQIVQTGRQLLKSGKVEFSQGLVAKIGQDDAALYLQQMSLYLSPDSAWLPRLEADLANEPALGSLRQDAEAIVKQAGADPATQAAQQEALALMLKADQLYEAGDLAGALAACNRAVQLDTHHVTKAYGFRGFVHQKMKAFDEAMADYVICLKYERDPLERATTYLNRGNILRARGLFQEALTSYNQSLALRPGSHLTHSVRAKAREELGDLQGALEDTEISLRLKPDYAEAAKTAERVRQKLQR